MLKNQLILVAVGANLPLTDGRPPVVGCAAAVQRLAALPGLALRACSRWYGSAPLPPTDQPTYVNGVVAMSAESPVEPMGLLAELQAIEADFGRRRSTPNAARSLDLDLLAVADITMRTADLVLPHPRLTERRFVLQPIKDVMPDWRHPVSGLGLPALLAALPPQPIWLLA